MQVFSAEGDFYARGVLNPQLTLLFSLEQVAETHETMEKGHVKGKIALEITPGVLPVSPRQAGRQATDLAR